MALDLEEQDKKTTLELLIITFTILLPAILVVVGVLVFYKTNIIKEVRPGEMVELQEGTITPGQLLENRYKYKDQKLTLRGKISQEPIVCERKECPGEDPCCGCRPERNLIITDAGRVVVQESAWRLRLLGPGGSAFCQRLPNSCEYDCPGWEVEGVYDVTGTFFAEPPPVGTGWKVYFDFYFEVEDKRLVEKIGIADMPARFFKGIQELIEKIRTSAGYYILQ